jgi:hypothetical protein
VPAGSVVVLASASHMARVGTAAYADDFVKARGRLVGVMGVESSLCMCMVYPCFLVALMTAH